MINNYTDLKNAVAQGGSVDVSSSDLDLITIPEAITVDRPTRIIGGNFDVQANYGFVVNSSDVEIAAGRYRGKGTSATYDKSKFIYALGPSVSNPIANVKIHNNAMRGSTGDNIWVRHVVNSKITDNYIFDYLYSGIMLISCKGVRVAVNDVRNATMKDGVVNTYGIAATDMANTVEARSSDISIVGNIISDQPWEAIDTHGGYRITITGNIITNSRRGIALVVGNDSRVVVPQRCVVTGNYVDGNGSDREGISLFGLPGNPADAIITGNTVEGFNSNLHLSYYNRGLTKVSGNNIPQVSWTPISLSSGWIANGNYPPEYMVDNDTVFFRGMVIPSSGAPVKVGAISSAYTPSSYTFIATTKAAANGATGTGQIGVTPAGDINMLYRTSSDSYSYAIDGSYKMI